MDASQVITHGQMIAIPQNTSMDVLIHEYCSNNAEAKYTLMYWLRFEIDWIFSFRIGIFPLQYAKKAYLTETTSNKMSPREELTRFLFQSDNAEDRLGILTVASHWFMHTSMETVIFTTRKTGLAPSVKGMCTVNSCHELLVSCTLFLMLCVFVLWNRIFGNNFEGSVVTIVKYVLIHTVCVYDFATAPM